MNDTHQDDGITLNDGSEQLQQEHWDTSTTICLVLGVMLIVSINTTALIMSTNTVLENT